MMNWSMRIIFLGILLAQAAYFLSTYWMYIPAMIGQVRNPVLPTQQVQWRLQPEIRNRSDNTKPNIIVILVDDLGFNDISFFGGGFQAGSIRTPNIDSIGKNGVSFINGYAGHATCAPSRASLLTGRYPTKMGYEYTPISDWGSYVIGNYMSAGPLKGNYYGDRKNGMEWGYQNMSLPKSEMTIAEALKGHGYRNLHLGKVTFY